VPIELLHDARMFSASMESRATKGALGMTVRVIIELARDGARSNVKVMIFLIANGSLGYDTVVFSTWRDTCVRYKNVRPT